MHIKYRNIRYDTPETYCFVVISDHKFSSHLHCCEVQVGLIFAGIIHSEIVLWTTSSDKE